LLGPIRVIAPAGTVVNALPPAAVAGGNVEMSQRMVDTLLRAMAKAAPKRIPAASQGTMNKLTLRGTDRRHGAALPFAYYETIAGGMGARPGRDGASAVHTHMTNSWNTPVEVFEQVYPVRLKKYAVRRGSGGAGKNRGGDGIIREIELLTAMQVGFLGDRRIHGPYGLGGGKSGQVGRNTVIAGGKSKVVPGKHALFAETGTIVRIETPGGGGWGTPPQPKKAARHATGKKREGRGRGR